MIFFNNNEIVNTWNDIEQENLTGKYSRQIFVQSNNHIKASVVKDQNLRSIDLVFNKEEIASKKLEFKETKGIKVNLEGDKNFSDRLIICIYLKSKSFEDTYLKLIEKIINSIENINLTNEKFNIIINLLSNWRKCFENERYEGLSIEEQIGLIGELIQLEKIIQIGVTQENALSYWKGPDQGIHDFVHPKYTVEVKTTTVKKNKIKINNIKQFDYTFYKNLFLCVVFINKSLDGFTLVELIKKINKDFFEKLNLTNIFNNKLLNLGYLDIHNKFYQDKFNFIKLEYYKVNKNFPTLLPSNCSSFITDLTFNLSLDGCHDFKTNESFLII